MRPRKTFSLALLILVASSHLLAQAVVSAHAGVVNFFEGAVVLDGQPLTVKPGTFPNLKSGAVLRTEKGRAEILLTPGVLLRIDENSEVHMVSDSLASPRIEFLRGAAILDSNDAHGSNPFTLTYKTFQLRFPKPGVYRLDSDPGVFQTYTGEAQISADGQPTKTIDESHEFFFGIGMDTKKYGEGAIDTFSEWARTRAEVIAADNRVGTESTPDSSDPNVSPFGVPLPTTPSTIVPSYGTNGSYGTYGAYGGTALVDNTFYGGYNPFFGPAFQNPLTVIYVFPRPWRYPISPLPPRRTTGYPLLQSPSRMTSSHVPYMRASPLPRGNSLVRPAYSHTYVRPMVAPAQRIGPSPGLMPMPRMAPPPRMTGAPPRMALPQASPRVMAPAHR